MAVSLKAEHLKRYKDVAMLLIKYGRSDLISQAGLEDSFLPEDYATEKVSASAEELAGDLERLGPTYIKLGQLLSTRADILPGPYLDALAKLQDQIEPFPFLEVERIVSGELGVRISKAFAEFEPTPMAAASLSQVHLAYLRDGRAVVVKVQRPNIRDQIVDDLDALNELAHFFDSHTEVGDRFEIENMLNGLRKSLLRELDFTIEANNLLTIGQNLSEFENILVPEPILDFTTTRVLTMEFVAGKKITSVSPLRLLELNGPDLADELFRAYLKQILIDGLFHADPHPGNVFITDDGRIALLDLGMVGRIGRNFKDNLLRLLAAISNGDGDQASDLTIKMGEAREKFDRVTFRRRVGELVSENTDTSLNRLNSGMIVLEITRISADCWFRLAPEFTIIAKALLNLDRVVFTLDPTFDPNSVLRERATEIMERNILQSIAPANLLTGVAEIKEFAEKFPNRVNRILDAVGNNELRFKVDTIDEKVVLDGLQKVANRITLGLVVAALIVSAAMLMRVETTFRIFGYPGLATIFFVLAAAAGVFLVFNILFRDESPK